MPTPTADVSAPTARLEVMAQELGPAEFHFYTSSLAFADLAPRIAPALAGTQALIHRIPAGLLNPNYWEPHTTAGEEALRRAGAPVLTREESGASWLWRPDTIAPGRYLRDGISVPVERVPGAVFKIAGPDLLKLWAAWTPAGQDRFEWAAFKGPSEASAVDANEDLASFRIRTPGLSMLFAATGAGHIRLAFSAPGPWRACARELLRGFMSKGAARAVSAPNDTVCDQFLGMARWGLSAHLPADFTSRGWAYEFRARMGDSPWSKGWIGDESPPEDAILVYYDRVSGIWAVAA
jgi:hypothetical protein